MGRSAGALAALFLLVAGCFDGGEEPAEKTPAAKAAPKPPAKGKRKPKKSGEAATPAQPAKPKPPAPEGAPNVLIVVWDTTRADRMSLYGYDKKTTPSLDAFAQEAVVYERAISPGMWTLPSHASMFTGLPVSEHGAAADHKLVDTKFVTMAEWFGEHGFDTFLFSANPYLGHHTQLTQGFDVSMYPWGTKWKKKAEAATMAKVLPDDASNFLGPKWKKSLYSGGRSADKVKDAGPIAAEALFQWVDEREQKDRPWLAVLNYMETHVPRIPSMASREALFSKKEIKAQLALDQSFGYLLAYTTKNHEYTPEQIKVISDTYDASLLDLDKATAVLFEQLAQRDELDDTVVVLTADHGEHLGEHHRIGHKYSVYNPLIHVPLVIRYPKKLSATRVAKVVSNLSIYGTVAELAGLGLPDGNRSESLVAIGDHPGYAYSELVAPTPMALQRMSKVHKDFKWGPYQHTYVSVNTGKNKCIQRDDGVLEFYDAKTDWLESKDLSKKRKADAEALCGRAVAWQQSLDTYERKGKKGKDVNTPDMDEETKARLRAMGYLDDGEDK